MTTQIIIAILGSSALSALITNIFQTIRERNRKQSGEQKAIRILLSNDIRRTAEGYIAKGEISTDDLHDIIRSWECYHNDLQGNGYLDGLMNAVKRLPLSVHKE